MSEPNIAQILAALAQRPNHTPGPTQAQAHAQALPQSHPYQPPPPRAYPPLYPQAHPMQGAPSYSGPQPLPKPVNSGRIDISNIKPVNSGSLNINNAGVHTYGVPAERDEMYNGLRGGGPSRDADTRLVGSSYRPSRSRSRSPDRFGRENFRENYNPYRDERRAIPHQVSMPFAREQSFSPAIRGPQPGPHFSPPLSRDFGGSAERDNVRGVGDDNSETISINSGLVGLIIGRQGENLRRIEAETLTRVQFVTPPDAGGSERECKITGPAGQREHAKAEIYRVIQESGKAAGSSSGRAPPPPDRDMGVGIKQAGAHQPALRLGEDSITIKVPNRTVGLIIGKGGETIRDLQERSHCHVNIVGEEKSEGGLRPVNLIGTPEAARMAKEFIMDIVDTDTKNLTNQGARPSDNRIPFGGGNEKINDQIMVPSEAVGMIIGKGGETIKDMQSSTGCKINVSPATGQDIERHIGLVGSQESIERAKDAIMEKVHAVQEKNRPNGVAQRGEQFSDRRLQNHQQRQQNNQQDIQPTASEPDPYAAYGGYQNYVALWYSSLQANQGQQDQNPQGPPGS